MSEDSVVSGSRTAGRAWRGLTRGAATGAASHRASAAESPTTAALTMPTPVMTTSRCCDCAIVSDAPEEHGDVLAAEAERVGDRVLDGLLPGRARHAIEFDLRIGRRQPGGRWDRLLDQTQDGGDGLEASGRRHGVADHRFRGADQQAAGAEHAGQRAGLDAIVLRGARAVRVGVADLAG